eukprot:6461737-Amphidinium_carterae.2
MPTGAIFMWSMTHQTDRDAEERRVHPLDRQGKGQQNGRFNKKIKVPTHMLDLNLFESGVNGGMLHRLRGSFGSLYDHNFATGLNSSPGSGCRPVNQNLKLVGLHTGRGMFNDHYRKGQDCRPLKKKAARQAGFAAALIAAAAAELPMLRDLADSCHLRWQKMCGGET